MGNYQPLGPREKHSIDDLQQIPSDSNDRRMVAVFDDGNKGSQSEFFLLMSSSMMLAPFRKLLSCGMHGGLMVSTLVSQSSSPGSSLGRGHCVMFLRTLNSHHQIVGET